MANTSEVAEAANRFTSKDEPSLELLVGMVQKAIDANPALKDQVYVEPKYEANIMGPMDDVRNLGKRILKVWNTQLHALVCGNQAENKKDRQAILGALSLGETAVIGAVAGALIGLAVPAPLAAALAPLIVKKFIWPAKDELCEAWLEAIAKNP
jgi:hypothetical protein